MNYGKALRIIRSAKNISQKELSTNTRLDPSYISLIERGMRIPKVDTLEKIVKALNVPIYLFFLLASDEKTVSSMPQSKKTEIAKKLLEVLVSAERNV